MLVCPAYAVIILKYYLRLSLFASLSRVCGDDPAGDGSEESRAPFVPRMRG